MVHRSGPGGDGVLALRDPQQPKGFSGLEPTIVLHPGDRITTTCTFDTTSREVCLYKAQTNPAHSGCAGACKCCCRFRCAWMCAAHVGLHRSCSIRGGNL